MNQSMRVEQAPKNKRLIALAIDLAIIALSTFAMFFLMLYLVIGPMFNYSHHVKTYSSYLDQYELRLKEGDDYDKYEEVVKKFYFEYFTDEMIETLEKNYPNQHYSSITHIYNVYVYNLPYNPSPSGDKYKSDLYEYRIDSETGEVLINELGIKRQDYSGPTYERYLKELMYTKYSELEGFLYDYNAEYKEAKIYKENIELSSRTVAMALSVIALTIVVPLCFKNGQTIGDKICDVAYAKNKGGFKIKPYHTILRSVTFYSLPIIGLAIFNRYSIVILLIFPIFISTLLLLFRSSERDLRDILSGTMAVDKENSLLFKSAGEASLYMKKEENQIVEDKEFLEKLQNAKEVELETSRDEQFKNKQK